MRSGIVLVATVTLFGCGDSVSPAGNGEQPPTVASVAVTPSTATLVSLGETVQLNASARDASGNSISGKTFTWSSADASIATVSSSALVTAVANGSVTITATTDGINGTAAVDVNQVAAQLAFIVEPTTTDAGVSIVPAVEVAIQDALGNLVAGATDAVTVAIGTNPAAGTLSGTTTVNAVAGVASFTDLTIDKGGTGYTLLATSGSLSSATSAAFGIVDFAVNTADDVDDGTCDATHCSLREALNAANANPGSDLVGFDIPGSGPHTIQPTSALPTITDPVIIDGYTQPGASPNTNGPGLGSNAVLKIELDGSNAGAGATGLSISAGSSTVRGLAINRFDFGIRLETNGGNVVEGNFIGVGVAGTTALGNSIDGVLIFGAPNNTIGGTTAGARNIISGNRRGGAFIFGDGAGIVIKGGRTGNLVQGNFIGTDVTGTAELGNLRGVLIFDAPGNTIGGTIPAARNVVSGNDRIGIRIDIAATGNLVQGNFIGTDVSGIEALGNGHEGVVIFGASGNSIGGTTSGAGNVISANGRLSTAAGGVRIQSSTATGNLVQGNFIGTDVTGTLDLGNSSDGVKIGDAPNNTIGGTTAGARNIISNNLTGVFIASSGATGNLVQGNFIGTDVTGTEALGNSLGVFISFDASDNTIGGVANGASNTIAFNGSGMSVFSGTGNAILSNSIFSNANLGIDLLPGGVTPNDAGDGDTGANNLQNFPVLSSATSSGSSITIVGDLNSAANTDFRLELFANSVCDPSGNGEGETFLGSTMVTTDGSGNASFTVTFTATVAVGQFITATATDPNNNTSEFSQCTTVT